MKVKKTNKIISKGLRVLMKVIPLCAMAMTVISANVTACWMQGQPETPKNLRNYRKF